MASDAMPGLPAPTLSIVVPTYKESKNISLLFARITAALDGAPWEMIVVDDDSPDGTADVAFGLAAKDNRLRCLRRVNRSGLAGAVIEGWMSSSADLVAVIDGDLQHDESILLAMYQVLAKGAGDLDGESANPAGAALYQEEVAGKDPLGLEQIGPHGNGGFRNGSRVA